MSVQEVNTPHPPQRMNILGRKRYSGKAQVTDVIDYSFDDCWRAIGLLWAAVAGLGLIVYKTTISKKK